MPIVRPTSHHNPFGMVMPSRNWTAVSADGYRFGFGGQEEINDLLENNSALDFGERFYSPRLGRWFSLDAFQRVSSNESLYSYVGNQVLIFIDSKGDFKYPAGLEEEYTKKYPILTSYLKNDIDELLSNPRVMEVLTTFSNLPPDEIAKYMTWGEGPTINVVEMSLTNGKYKNSEIYLDQNMLKDLEDALSADKTPHLLFSISTLLHEFVHFGNDITGVDEVGEQGTNFETELYGINIDSKEDASTVIDYDGTPKDIIPKAPNIQRLDDIIFDSNKARNVDGELVVKDLITDKDYSVIRNEDGSYNYKTND